MNPPSPAFPDRARAPRRAASVPVQPGPAAAVHTDEAVDRVETAAAARAVDVVEAVDADRWPDVARPPKAAPGQTALARYLVRKALKDLSLLAPDGAPDPAAPSPPGSSSMTRTPSTAGSAAPV